MIFIYCFPGNLNACEWNWISVQAIAAHAGLPSLRGLILSRTFEWTCGNVQAIVAQKGYNFTVDKVFSLFLFKWHSATGHDGNDPIDVILDRATF